MDTGAKVLAATVAGTGVAFIGVASYSAGSQEDSFEAAAVPAQTEGVPEGAYQGICAVVTPPDPDPCDAVSGTLRYASLGALVNVPYLRLWRNANPGEATRLASIMASPRCSIASDPQPQVMLTHYGAHLAALMQSIACARHPEPIVWPPANPALDPRRADKTPPSSPGPLQVTP